MSSFGSEYFNFDCDEWKTVEDLDELQPAPLTDPESTDDLLRVAVAVASVNEHVTNEELNERFLLAIEGTFHRNVLDRMAREAAQSLEA